MDAITRTFLLLLPLIMAPLTSGLVCYTCVYTAGDSSRACIDDPKSVTSGSATVTCKTSMKYCTIRRQEIVSTGEVQSFYRNCEEDPTIRDDVVEDYSFRTYFRSCQTSLCNSGDGKTSLGGATADRDPGASGSLVVPGVGGASSLSSTHCTLVVTVMLALVQMLLA